MCPPVIAAVGLGIAQGGMSYIGQKQMASAQRRSQAMASEAERKRYLQEVSSMRVQQGQEQVAAAQRIQAAQKKAREARATARVSAGEAGVAGLSVDALINDLTREEAENRFATQQQLQMNDVGRQMQLSNSGLGFTNNMLRINRPVQDANLLGSALEGAQTGLSTYTALK